MLTMDLFSERIDDPILPNSDVEQFYRLGCIVIVDPRFSPEWKGLAAICWTRLKPDERKICVNLRRRLLSRAGYRFTRTMQHSHPRIKSESWWFDENTLFYFLEISTHTHAKENSKINQVFLGSHALFCWGITSTRYSNGLSRRTVEIPNKRRRNCYSSLPISTEESMMDCRKSQPHLHNPCQTLFHREWSGDSHCTKSDNLQSRNQYWREPWPDEFLRRLWLDTSRCWCNQSCNTIDKYSDEWRRSMSYKSRNYTGKVGSQILLQSLQHIIIITSLQ